MTTEVEFHTGVADKVGFACRLLRKAYRRGARVLVTAPAGVLALVDRELWTFDEREFVPHVRLAPGTSASMVRRSPIWLVEAVDGAAPAGTPDILVNLGAPAPRDLAPFARLIEVVAAEPDEEDAGRERWRDYRARGLPVVHHGAAARG